MFRKSSLFLFGLTALMVSSGVVAQVSRTSSSIGYTGGYDWRDSSLIPAYRAAQQNDFLNNLYSFPAKPRNQWEFGVKAGMFNINGDVPAVFPTLGFGAHVRKSIGYTVSLRMEYMHGTGKGLHWSPSSNYNKNPAWTTNGYVADRVDVNGNQTPATDRIYYNYKANVNDLGLQALFSLSNIRFHKARNQMSLYMLAGIGMTWYETFVNARNGTSKYNFGNITNNPNYPSRNDIRSALRDLLDDSYETPAESHGDRKSRVFGGMTNRATATVGFGAAFKINKRVNISIEDRMTFTGDDLLDGQRWQVDPFGDAAQTRNFDTFNFLSVGLNFNLF
jgi:hypothetical protein